MIVAHASSFGSSFFQAVDILWGLAPSVGLLMTFCCPKSEISYMKKQWKQRSLFEFKQIKQLREKRYFNSICLNRSKRKVVLSILKQNIWTKYSIQLDYHHATITVPEGHAGISICPYHLVLFITSVTPLNTHGTWFSWWRATIIHTLQVLWSHRAHSSCF